jgi:hypothetical protein
MAYGDFQRFFKYSWMFMGYGKLALFITDTEMMNGLRN